MVVTNQESSELFLYTFKPVCRTSSKAPRGKLPNLLGIKLTTNVTLIFLSAVNNDTFVYFYVAGVEYESI